MTSPMPLDAVLDVVRAHGGREDDRDMLEVSQPRWYSVELPLERAGECRAALGEHGWDVVTDTFGGLRLDHGTDTVLVTPDLRIGDVLDAVGDTILDWDTRTRGGISALTVTSPFGRTRFLPVPARIAYPPGYVCGPGTLHPENPVEQLAVGAQLRMDSRPFGAAYVTADPVAHTAGVLTSDAAALPATGPFEYHHLMALAQGFIRSVTSGESILATARALSGDRSAISLSTPLRAPLWRRGRGRA